MSGGETRPLGTQKPGQAAASLGTWLPSSAHRPGFLWQETAAPWCSSRFCGLPGQAREMKGGPEHPADRLGPLAFAPRLWQTFTVPSGAGLPPQQCLVTRPAHVARKYDKTHPSVASSAGVATPDPDTRRFSPARTRSMSSKVSYCSLWGPRQEEWGHGGAHSGVSKSPVYLPTIGTPSFCYIPQISKLVPPNLVTFSLSPWRMRKRES